MHVQKGLFLLSMEGPERALGAYTFRPYEWGPFSRTVYEDLESKRLVVTEAVAGRRWRQYRVTRHGVEIAQRIAQDLDASEVEYLEELRRYLTASTFAGLLRSLYKDYPEYATQSRFRG